MWANLQSNQICWRNKEDGADGAPVTTNVIDYITYCIERNANDFGDPTFLKMVVSRKRSTSKIIIMAGMIFSLEHGKEHGICCDCNNR